MSPSFPPDPLVTSNRESNECFPSRKIASCPEEGRVKRALETLDHHSGGQRSAWGRHRVMVQLSSASTAGPRPPPVPTPAVLCTNSRFAAQLLRGAGAPTLSAQMSSQPRACAPEQLGQGQIPQALRMGSRQSLIIVI